MRPMSHALTYFLLHFQLIFLNISVLIHFTNYLRNGRWLIFKESCFLFKVPITPKIFLARNKSLYRTEQDSANIFSFG